MALDTRWKNPPSSDPEQLFRWAQDLISELRKGAYFDKASSGFVAGPSPASSTNNGFAKWDGATGRLLKDSAATIGTGDIANDAVTYAKLQNISAQFRALGRNSASAGDAEEVTLSQLLDWIGSAAQGDILYRGASSWARLGAGTNRQFLQTQGAAADPQYAFAGMTLLASGSVSSAATLDLVLTSYAAYRAIVIYLSSFLPATDDVELWMRFSTDGGSNYDATGYSFANQTINEAVTNKSSGSGAANQIRVAGANGATDSVSNVAAEGGADAQITLFGRTSTARWTRAQFHSSWNSAFSEENSNTGQGTREATQDTDAVRFLFETGNITSGDYAVYGLA
jgi:hypothetical protein